MYNDSIMVEKINISRAVWAGRRGLLELDLLLEPYIRSEFGKMSDLDQRHVYEFLKFDDDKLFDWFFGSGEVPDKYLVIVTDVLEFYTKKYKVH